MFYGKLLVTFVYNFALRKFGYRGQWCATPKKNRGRSKKTLEWTALKSRGGSLAVVPDCMVLRMK